MALVFAGVSMVAASVVLAEGGTRERTCSGSCTGTKVCDALVAWCCCRPGTGAYACVCSANAECNNTTSVPGEVCQEGNNMPDPGSND